jgi:hypothetical protein
MVRAALVVSVTSRSRSHSRRLVGPVPAAAATATDGGCARERESDRAEPVAGGAAAVVRDALVVSAWWHREHAAIDDANNHTDDAGGHDAPSAATRLDATAAGHVFCLTALTMDVRYDVRQG